MHEKWRVRFKKNRTLQNLPLRPPPKKYEQTSCLDVIQFWKKKKEELKSMTTNRVPGDDRAELCIGDTEEGRVSRGSPSPVEALVSERRPNEDGLSPLSYVRHNALHCLCARYVFARAKGGAFLCSLIFFVFQNHVRQNSQWYG